MSDKYKLECRRLDVLGLNKFFEELNDKLSNGYQIVINTNVKERPRMYPFPKVWLTDGVEATQEAVEDVSEPTPSVDTTNEETPVTDVPAVDELEVLKAEAKELGFNLGATKNIDKAKAKIAAKKEELASA